MKVSVVISAGGSFCCNYATDLCIYGNYASDNVCCIFAGFEVVLSVIVMLVNLSVTIMQGAVSVAVMQQMGGNFYWNYADGNLCSELCT